MSTLSPPSAARPVDAPAAACSAALGRPDVVHVTHALKAGLRRYIVDLVTGLHELGLRQGLVHSSLVTDPATSGALAACAALGVATFSIPMVRAISPRDAASAWRVWRLVGRLRPDVLHLHSSKAGGVGRLAAAGLPNSIRVVYTPHASAANLSPRYASIERLLGRIRTDRVVAVSASEYDELRALRFVAPERLVRVDTGVPREELHRAASEPRPVLPAGRLVVAAGRLSPQKDPRFLVRVSRRVVVAHPDVRFVWAGDGELLDVVRQDIAEAGLADRWTLLDTLANPYPLLSAADVVALPSRYEGLPLVLLEAMALGRPTVATDVTGSRDLVVQGETGELVARGDEAGFAAAISRILTHPGLAARYGAEAERRVAAYHSRERMAAEMRAVYADLRR